MKEYINIAKRVIETGLKFIGLAVVARYVLESSSPIVVASFIAGIALFFIWMEEVIPND